MDIQKHIVKTIHVCNACLQPIGKKSTEELNNATLCHQCAYKIEVKRRLEVSGYIHIKNLRSKFKISQKGFTKCPVCNRICAVNGNLYKEVICKNCGIIFKQFSDSVAVQFTDTNEDVSQFKVDYFDGYKIEDTHKTELQKQRERLKELWKSMNLNS